MELSEKYKKLYKHWELHTDERIYKSNRLNNDLIDDIKYFIDERISIFINKENNITPYTKDNILSQYRFCNIYRELDRQTIHYHTHLKHIENDFHLWVLNMIFCRSICNTQTIDKLGIITLNNYQDMYNKLMDLSSPKYGNAYIFPISVIQKSKWNTREKFFCMYYPKVICNIVDTIKTFKRECVIDALDKILPIFGFNLKFLWTEVLIDIAYQYPQYIDLYKEFPIGPGSIPTMKMLNCNCNPIDTNHNMIGMFDNELNLLTYNNKKIVLSAENWEGIGCEYRKYYNLKNNKGRKRYYN